MDNTYRRCVEAYEHMSQHGEVRTASWLEGHDYDIEFLKNFDSVAIIYEGPLKDLAKAIGCTGQTMSSVIRVMKACGWLHVYKVGLYALYKEPIESDYQDYLVRTTKFDREEGKSSLRREMEAYVLQLHKRYDEVVKRLQTAEEKIRELEHYGRTINPSGRSQRPKSTNSWRSGRLLSGGPEDGD